MYEYKDRLIGSLSGGQQQKVFIARELLKKPNILFLDEPTVGIDINGQKEFYNILKELNEKLNLTIIIVSHDILIVKKEVKKLCLIKDKNVIIHDSSISKSTLFELLEG
jgi:zinc transport system ATP-binding protein